MSFTRNPGSGLNASMKRFSNSSNKKDIIVEKQAIASAKPSALVNSLIALVRFQTILNALMVYWIKKHHENQTEQSQQMLKIGRRKLQKASSVINWHKEAILLNRDAKCSPNGHGNASILWYYGYLSKYLQNLNEVMEKVCQSTFGKTFMSVLDAQELQDDSDHTSTSNPSGDFQNRVATSNPSGDLQEKQNIMLFTNQYAKISNEFKNTLSNNEFAHTLYRDSVGIDINHRRIKIWYDVPAECPDKSLGFEEVKIEIRYNLGKI